MQPVAGLLLPLLPLTWETDVQQAVQVSPGLHLPQHMLLAHIGLLATSSWHCCRSRLWPGQHESCLLTATATPKIAAKPLAGPAPAALSCSGNQHLLRGASVLSQLARMLLCRERTMRQQQALCSAFCSPRRSWRRGRQIPRPCRIRRSSRWVPRARLFLL